MHLYSDCIPKNIPADLTTSFHVHVTGDFFLRERGRGRGGGGMGEFLMAEVRRAFLAWNVIFLLFSLTRINYSSRNISEVTLIN